MIQKTLGPIDRSLWDDSFVFLNKLREIGDPEADEAVSRYIERTGTAAAPELARNLMLALVKNPWTSLDEGKQGLGPELQDFIDKHSAPPPWANPQLIQRGQVLFMNYGPMAMAALLCASLPECYSHKNGALLLWYTLRLKEHTVRRVYETARMILKVMSPQGLAPNSGGVLLSLKTRLLHAVIRYMVLTSPPAQQAPESSLADELLQSRWDSKLWGTPINQEDNAFTLLTFSYVILRSWKRLGLPLTDEDCEAYLHCWNVVGYYLGIREDLFATTWADASFMFERLQQHEQTPSQEGQELTQALLSVLRTVIPGDFVASHLEYTLMRFFMSDRTAAVLGLPPMTTFDHVLKGGVELWSLLNKGANVVGNLAAEANSRLPVPVPRSVTDAVDGLAWRAGAASTDLLVTRLGFSAPTSEQVPGEVKSNLRQQLQRLSTPLSESALMDQIGAAFMGLRAGSSTPKGPVTYGEDEPAETQQGGTQRPAPPVAFLIEEELRNTWQLSLEERIQRASIPRSNPA